MRALIEHISKWDPSLPRSVRGASQDEVAALEKLAGRSLPPAYRDFLLSMGHGTGSLRLFGGNADFRIDAVTDFYTNTLWRPSRDALFIGRELGGSGTDFFLDKIPTEPEFRVALLAVGEDNFEPIVVYPALPNMLMSLAFAALRIERLPHRARFSASGRVKWDEKSGSRIQGFHRLALSLAFEPAPFTGSWAAAYDRRDAGLTCYQMPGCGPSFSAAAETEDSLAQISSAMTQQLALVRTK